MTAPMTTVRHLPSGRTWRVRAFTSRPNNARRVALRVASVGGAGGILIPCVACGVLTTVTGSVNRDGIAVATGQADRIVNDHPSFHVGREVWYSLDTTANVCPSDNGTPGERSRWWDSLERVALRLLDEHGREV